jgi:hypothetical protein
MATAPNKRSLDPLELIRVFGEMASSDAKTPSSVSLSIKRYVPTSKSSIDADRKPSLLYTTRIKGKSYFASSSSQTFSNSHSALISTMKSNFTKLKKAKKERRSKAKH